MEKSGLRFFVLVSESGMFSLQGFSRLLRGGPNIQREVHGRLHGPFDWSSVSSHPPCPFGRAAAQD